MISFTPQTLPPITEEERTKLKALMGRPDSEIDYSDIPPLTDDFWKSAVRGRFYKPTKRQITARVDADVLEWLKSQGKGYQSRLNAILRREMLTSLKGSSGRKVKRGSRKLWRSAA
ncbi:MAG: BrnA antitoxin family protein [Hyphomicrobiales bacterium]|nr:BrnA antitoxin family protein [Hyphomicrobiales bacterium]